jgi:hypothetical protein
MRLGAAFIGVERERPAVHPLALNSSFGWHGFLEALPGAFFARTPGETKAQLVTGDATAINSKLKYLELSTFQDGIAAINKLPCLRLYVTKLSKSRKNLAH